MDVFCMPSLGSDMEAGVLVEWLVEPGDEIKRGDIVAVVETQKGAIEIEIFQTGYVDKLVAAIGDELPVGAPMADIRIPGEPEVRAPDRSQSQTNAPGPPPSRPPRPASGAIEDRPAAPRASPAARRRAREAGIDLAVVAGSGPGGAVRLHDVEQSIAAPGAAARASTLTKPRFDPAPMRAAIAAAMARSKREIPHYYLSHAIDLQAANDWLKDTNATRPPDRRLLMGLLLVRATALAVRKAPALNGTWEDGAFNSSDKAHVGLAVSLRGGGLVAPALHDADTLCLEDLMERMRELVARARTGRLRSSEIADPTLTVSSLGERGVDRLHGVIFPPQVAIVGFGAPRSRPVVDGEKVSPRIVVEATLAADHRVSDGRVGARFLAEVSNLLQRPEAL